MTRCLKGSLILLAALATIATGFVAQGTAQERNEPKLILHITVCLHCLSATDFCHLEAAEASKG